MRAARRTLALQLFAACACAALVTCVLSAAVDDEDNAIEDETDYEFEPTEPYRPEDHADDVDAGDLRKPATSIARKLWDCVEDNETMTCMKDLFYNEFDSKVMRNRNLVLLKSYINKYMSEYMKRKRLTSDSGESSKYSGYDLFDERQDVTTLAPVEEEDAEEDGHRGMKKKMMDFIPFLLAPALLMAGVMPWLLPPLKMMVMFVGMLNQFAFSSALFSLVRNYVFNRREDEHVFYINHGYQNQKHR